MTSRRRWGRDGRGSAPIEAVLLLPVLVLLIGLVIAGARVALAKDAVTNVAASAARAASLARTVDEAREQARQVADATLDSTGLDCTRSTVELDLSGFRVAAGQPADVTATVSCTVPFGDLAGLSGRRTLEASATQPLDRFRARR